LISFSTRCRGSAPGYPSISAVRSCSSWLKTFWLRPHSRCSVERTRKRKSSAPSNLAASAGPRRSSSESVSSAIVRVAVRSRSAQRQEELRVVGLEPLKIIDLAHLVTDDHAEIPQRVEKPVDETLLGGADAAAEEKQEIDIRMQTEVPAPVAAERDDGDRTVIGTRVGKELADQGVDPIGVPLKGAAPAGAARNRGAQLLPRGIERCLQGGAGRTGLRYGHEGNIRGTARTII